MICLWLFRTLLSQQIYEREITLYSQRDWYLVSIQAVSLWQFTTIVNVSMTKNIFSFDFLHLRQEIWCNIWANWSVWLYWLGVCAMMSTIVELTMLFKQSMYLFLYLCMPSDIFYFLQSDWPQQRRAFLISILTVVQKCYFWKRTKEWSYNFRTWIKLSKAKNHFNDITDKNRLNWLQQIYKQSHATTGKAGLYMHIIYSQQKKVTLKK